MHSKIYKADLKTRKTQGIIVYSTPEILEGTPAEKRIHAAHAIYEVFEWAPKI